MAPAGTTAPWPMASSVPSISRRQFSSRELPRVHPIPHRGHQQSQCGQEWCRIGGYRRATRRAPTNPTTIQSRKTFAMSLLWTGSALRRKCAAPASVLTFARCPTIGNHRIGFAFRRRSISNPSEFSAARLTLFDNVLRQCCHCS